MTGETQSEQHAIFNAIPLGVPETGVATKFLFVPSPWGVPLTVGLLGEAASPPDPSVWIALDDPVPWLRPDAPLHKVEMEWLHVQRFATDYTLALGGKAYDALEPNQNDPPDFIATTLQGDRFGIELAALGLEDRRGADSLFQVLRQKLVLQHRYRTEHLIRFRVVVWFGEGQNPLTRPPRKSDDAAADELIEALATYRPQFQNIVMPANSGLPEQLPGLGTVTTPRNASFYAVPLAGAVPTSPFFCLTGFEMSLAYTTIYTAASVQSIIGRLIQDHDKPGVDILLISVGAPDRSGAIHHAEDILANFYLEHPGIFQPEHIQRVILHRWISGEAFDLLGPTPTRLFGPLYAGLSVSAQPIVPIRPANQGIASA